jgi:hypothetical protein
MSFPRQTNRAILLLVIQATLVLSIAGKYLYERRTCPRAWVGAAQFDPNQPLRGRYLAMQLTVDACALPRDEAHRYSYYPNKTDGWQWSVRSVVQNGKLVPVPAKDTDRRELTDELTLRADHPCERATLSQGVDFFIPDLAKGPFPLGPREELWVEVTVPPMGPPRPIQLALSKDGVFTPLKF